MLIEMHMLKNFPPTNLNRDDTGAPKTCLFAGVQRGRISSQCVKRSYRQSDVFSKAVEKWGVGTRTRKLPELAAATLKKMGVAEEYMDEVKKKVSGFGNKEGKVSKDAVSTAQMAFYSPEDVQAIADLLAKVIQAEGSLEKFKKIETKDLQKKLTDVKSRPITMDIALFGRMVTSDAFADVDAAMQVAHVLSTNRVTVESDFFTAVDDLIAGDNMDNLGAGMIGDVDYSACCYYYYASLDTDILESNLKNVENKNELIKAAIPAIVQAMALSNPSGKQNSFAGHILPSAVLIECKEDKVPLSYVNAFAEPSKASVKKDLTLDSIDKFLDEVAIADKDFELPVSKRLWFCTSKYDKKIENGENCLNFNDLVNKLQAVIS